MMADFRHEHDLHHPSYFRYLQIISSIQENWKHTIKRSGCNENNLVIHNNNLIKGSGNLTAEKLALKEI